MIRKPMVFLAAVALLPAGVGLAEPIQAGARLTLEQCLEIARKTNPQIRAAEQQWQASKSRVGQARSAYLPQVDWTSRYSHSGGTNTSSNQFSSQSSDQYGTSLGVNQNIYDFGKTSNQVKIATLNADSSGFSRDNVSSQVVLQVKRAYYTVLQKQKAEAVAVELVTQTEAHLKQAQAFYTTGRSAKFDVTKAQVDLGNARLGLIQAQNDIRLAFANLNIALGIPETPEYTLADNLSVRHPEVALNDVVRIAYRNRPDLNASQEQVKAAEASVALARTGYYPALTGNGAYGWSGSDFPLDNSWDVGVALSVPVFDGFLTKNKIGEARANLKNSQAQEETVRQGVYLDVKQSFIALENAVDKIPVAELTVTQAKENLDLANGRYKAGVGSPVDVTDSELAYSQAQNAYIQALFDYQSARAALEKAMGVL